MARNLEIGVSALLIVASAAIFVETLELPPPVYDPIGPAAFPRVLSVIIGILALVVIVSAVRRPSLAAVQDGGQPRTYRLRPDLALGSTLLTTGYVVLLAFRPFSFAVLTTLYLVVQIMLLFDFERRRLPAAVLLAAVFGFGSDYIFTQLFFIDLP